MGYGKEEATLLVFLKTGDRTWQFITNVATFSRLNAIGEDLKARNEKYFFKKDLLIVHEISECYLREVVAKLEETGDFFEVMRPLSRLHRLRFRWKFFLERYLENIK